MVDDFAERRVRFGFGLALIVFVLLADQISKWWVLEVVHLPARGQIAVLPFFDLTFVRNHGVSFGMLRADSHIQVWLLTGLAAAISGLFLWWMRASERTLTTAACGLIVGGALGNMIDRVRFAHVVDFLDFSALYFPWVFNVADASITIGAVLLILDYFTTSETRADAAKSG